MELFTLLSHGPLFPTSDILLLPEVYIVTKMPVTLRTRLVQAKLRVLKYTGEIAHVRLFKLVSKIYINGKIPQDFKESILCAVAEKIRKTCDNS